MDNTTTTTDAEDQHTTTADAASASAQANITATPADTHEEKPKGRRPLLKAAERKICWTARDAYWTCLDKFQDDTTFCWKQNAEYEKVCPKRWIKHFVGARQKEKYRKLLENQ